MKGESTVRSLRHRFWLQISPAQDGQHPFPGYFGLIFVQTGRIDLYQWLGPEISCANWFMELQVTDLDEKSVFSVTGSRWQNCFLTQTPFNKSPFLWHFHPNVTSFNGSETVDHPWSTKWSRRVCMCNFVCVHGCSGVNLVHDVKVSFMRKSMATFCIFTVHLKFLKNTILFWRKEVSSEMWHPLMLVRRSQVKV